MTFADCVDDVRSKIAKLNELGHNDKGQNAEYSRKDFKQEYITLLSKITRFCKISSTVGMAIRKILNMTLSKRISNPNYSTLKRTHQVSL